MSDDFVRTIHVDADSNVTYEDDQEEEFQKNELNPTFSFGFTDSERSSIHPWDFSTAKRSLQEDQGTSVDDKIKNRLAYKKEKEGRSAKRTKLANVNVARSEDDDNEIEVNEEEENEESSNDNEEDEEEEKNDDVNEEHEEEEEQEVEEEAEKPKPKTKKVEKDELRELSKKGNKKKQEASGYFETAPSLSSSVSFEDLELSKPLLKAVTALGYTSPTPIQAQAIPIAMGNKDIVGSAQTGSGKTAAFMLPILHKILLSDRRIPAIKCLVLAPTRELAVQCHSVSEKLARFTNLRCCLVIGGLSNAAQEAQLRTNPDIVVATPGRLIDHLRNAQSISLDELEYLVIDEADRLLEVGFIEAVEEIIKYCPRNRQSLLFSATMTEAVDRLIKVSLNKPVRVSVDKTTDVATNLSQEFVKMKSDDLREATLLALCSRTIKSNCIVFFAQKKEAHRAKLLFGLSGLNAAELHGNMTQRARLDALEKFRDGKTDFLLATDVAARGLDIMGIETVINFTMPTKLTTYIHRVGRTARAGEKGLSVSLAGEDDRALLKQIIKYAKSKVKQRIVPPEAIAECKQKIATLQDDIKAIYKEENTERELRKTEMHATRMENMLLHEDEIMGRPKKTWFVSSRDKLKIRENAKSAANEADYSDEDNEQGGGKNRKRKSREEREEIRHNQRQREKKKIAKEMKSQTVSAKAFKREARNKKLGIASKESKGPIKQKKQKKSNFDVNFQDNTKQGRNY